MEETITYDERMERISRYLLCMLTYDHDTVEYGILRREVTLEMDAARKTDTVRGRRRKGASALPFSI